MVFKTATHGTKYFDLVIVVVEIYYFSILYNITTKLYEILILSKNT